MAAKGTISSMGYLTIRTKDLSASIKNATEILGLRLVEDSGKKAFLTATNTAHEVVFLADEDDAIDHYGVTVDNLDELAAIHAKVVERGYPIVAETPIEDHIDTGFAFVGPAGFTWQVYLNQEWWDFRGGGFGPDRYGHINYKAPDPEAQVKFLTEVFGMRVSDKIGNGVAYFLRCNSDHHGVAVMKAPTAELHHHAWQTQSIVDLGRLGDRLARREERLLWGPVRHGAGHNIAAYYQEPSGGVVELYCDMEQIFNDERRPYEWSDEDLYWVNQWDGLRPDYQKMGALGTKAFDRKLGIPVH